jgi:hypothetical protein
MSLPVQLHYRRRVLRTGSDAIGFDDQEFLPFLSIFGSLASPCKVTGGDVCVSAARERMRGNRLRRTVSDGLFIDRDAT